MVGTRKGYETVYWGKMPINYRLQAFRRKEVERAVASATRSFPDVLGLVPDFSVLTVGKDLGCEETAVLVLGDEGSPGASVATRGRGTWRGCCGRSPYESGRGGGARACPAEASVTRAFSSRTGPG
jgi:hypothetical protein